MTRKRLLWILATLAYAAAIFVVSSGPVGDGKPLCPIPHCDWLLHALEFGLFYLLAYKAIGRPWLALLMTVAYAGTDELHQAFVPSREASLIDLAFDTLGAGLAAVGIAVWKRVVLSLPDRRRILLDRRRGSGEEERGG